MFSLFSYEFKVNFLSNNKNSAAAFDATYASQQLSELPQTFGRKQ